MTHADIINFQERARDYYDLAQLALIQAQRAHEAGLHSRFTHIMKWEVSGNLCDASEAYALAREALCYELTEPAGG